MLKEKTSDVSMTNTNQGSGTSAEAAVPMSHGLWNTWRKNLLLFCLTGVYVELCLHLCVFGSMDRYAGYPVLFGLLGGALCTLVVSSLPKVLRQITGLLLVAAQVMLAEVQLVYHCIFGDFMPVSQIGMGGNVIVNFNSQLLYGIRQNLLKILLLLLPLVVVILCLALRRVQALRFRLRWKQAMASFAVLLALLLTVTGLCTPDGIKPSPSIIPLPMWTPPLTAATKKSACWPPRRRSFDTCSSAAAAAL